MADGGHRVGRLGDPVIIAALVVGAALRFVGLGFRDFWFDESCTYACVATLFDRADDAPLFIQGTNLLYYVCVRGWTSLFGDGETAYRSLSAVASTAAIPVVASLAWCLRGRSAARVCAAVAALHPLQIHYAHEARAYAMWTLAAAVALVALYYANRRDRWALWGLYGVTAVVCLLTHVVTVFLLPATVLGACVAPDRRRALRRWFVTTALVGLVFAPYFVFVVWPVASAGPGAWLVRAWDPWWAIPRSLWALMPSGSYPVHLRGLSIASPDTVRLASNAVAAAAAAMPAVVLVLLTGRVVLRHVAASGRVRRAHGARGSYAMLVGLTLLPLITLWLYSVVVAPAYLVARYDLMSWPACIVLIAVVIVDACAAPRRGLRVAGSVAVGVVLVVCAMLPIARMFALRPGPTLAHARAERIAALTGPRDIVVAFSADKDDLGYYAYRAGCAARVVSFPSWLDKQIGWLDTASDTSPAMVDAVASDAAARVRLIRRAISTGARVFVLDDALDPDGVRPRSRLRRVFDARLRDAGIDRVAVDRPLGIWRLVRPREDAGPAGADHP